MCECLIDAQGIVQLLKRSGHKSLGALPSNQLSYQHRVVALFCTVFEVKTLKEGEIGMMPTQKKNLFLGGILSNDPGGLEFR